MSFGVAGSSPFGPFTKSVHEIIKDKLASSWTATDPAKEDGTDADKQNTLKLKFGLEYTAGDISKTYEIRCVRMPLIPTGENATGMRLEGFDANVGVHLWVRRNDLAELAQLQKMENEVSRIVADNRTAFGQGLQFVKITQVRPAHDPTSYGADGYWHLLMVLSCVYMMANG